jgi:hypothetical protein
LDNGNVGYAIGVFDKKSGEFVYDQRIETKELDDELAQKHRGKNVIFA